MRFDRVRIPSTNPRALCEWYRSVFGLDAPAGSETANDAISTVELGESTVELTTAESTSPVHIAFRLLCEPDAAREWLAERSTILPVEGHSSRYFEFLDATAIYFEDPEHNVLEALCYAGDRRPPTASRQNRVEGITEIGLPAREPLALVEWLEETVGLSAWGSPSETFAWVGNRDARFVVVPADRPWYPTDRTAALTPISVRLSSTATEAGRYQHPSLPYEIIVQQQ